MLGTIAAPTHDNGRGGASTPWLVVREHLLILKHSLRSGGSLLGIGRGGFT